MVQKEATEDQKVDLVVPTMDSLALSLLVVLTVNQVVLEEEVHLEDSVAVLLLIPKGVRLGAIMVVHLEAGSQVDRLGVLLVRSVQQVVRMEGLSVVILLVLVQVVHSVVQMLVHSEVAIQVVLLSAILTVVHLAIHPVR